MFLNVESDYVPTLRAALSMVPGKAPYFEPNGPGDQKYFVVSFCKTYFESTVARLKQKFIFIKRKCKKPGNFFVDKTIVEANQIFMEIANIEVMNEEASLGGSPLTPTPSRPTTPLHREFPENHKNLAILASKSPGIETFRITRSTLLKQSNSVMGRPGSQDMSIMFTGPRVLRAIYPPPPQTGGITITNEDEFCLNSGEFLNDVIIDFYLKYIMLELVNEKDRARSYVFSSFFYKQLTHTPVGRHKQSSDTKQLTPSQRRHKKVQKWTRNVDIFEKDFIFVPINEASHWYLAVICFPRQEDGCLFDTSQQ
uniref:Ubiquitin-like protease family profile domain-containing protein n=1 Tax=Ciona savignyi TaxID=51511 RepID=H2ZMA8_CIOSA